VGEGEATVYDELWSGITSVDPKFAAPSAKEDDQAFLRRFVQAANGIPETFEFSPEAEAWFAAAADRFTAGQDIDPLPGYNDDADPEAEAEGEGEAEPEQEAAPAPVHKGAQALAKYRAEKTAAAAKAAAPAGRRAVATPPAAPARATRAAAPAAPAGRRAVTPPPPATPSRRVAANPVPPKRAAPAAERPQSVAQMMRQYIIECIAAGEDVTGDDVMTWIKTQEVPALPTISTVAGVLTFTKNTIAEVKAAGHWKD
jgi:hypothetical protein